MSDLPDTDLDAMLQKCPSKLLLPIKFMDYCRLGLGLDHFLFEMHSPLFELKPSRNPNPNPKTTPNPSHT